MRIYDHFSVAWLCYGFLVIGTSLNKLFKTWLIDHTYMYMVYHTSDLCPRSMYVKVVQFWFSWLLLCAFWCSLSCFSFVNISIDFWSVVLLSSLASFMFYYWKIHVIIMWYSFNLWGNVTCIKLCEISLKFSC